MSRTFNCSKCSHTVRIRCLSCNWEDCIEVHSVFHDLCIMKCKNCIQRLEGEVAKLACAQRAAAEAADGRYSKKVSKLSATLGFLKLQPPKPSTESGVLNGDVTILVQGCDVILAHRLILAGKSPVFRRMFDSEMTESRSGIVNIDDASHATMQTVVQFCYTAKVDFTEDVHADEVLRVAHKYEILHLRDLCSEELIKRICEENLIEIIKLSRDCEAKQLREAAGEFLEEHFKELYPTLVEAL